jgi:hypothetical protein
VCQGDKLLRLRIELSPLVRPWPADGEHPRSALAPDAVHPRPGRLHGPPARSVRDVQGRVSELLHDLPLRTQFQLVKAWSWYSSRLPSSNFRRTMLKSFFNSRNQYPVTVDFGPPSFALLRNFTCLSPSFLVLLPDVMAIFAGDARPSLTLIFRMLAAFQRCEKLRAMTVAIALTAVIAVLLATRVAT